MSAGEWRVEQLDLDRYLARIGHAGDTPPTAATLAALHRAHVAAIGFENLDIVLGRRIDVALTAIQAKLVDRHRGGYCYEHNLLFAAALERLGFGVRRLLGRVGDADPPHGRTHMVLAVEAGGERWLADVGFGSGLLEPLPLAPRGPHAQGAWTYELRALGEGAWELRARDGGDWAVAYRFDEVRQHHADVVVASHFSSTHPSSPFVGRAVAVRKDREQVVRLVDRTLTVTRPAQPVETRRLGDAELAAALRDVFGLHFDAGERAQLLAALPA